MLASDHNIECSTLAVHCVAPSLFEGCDLPLLGGRSDEALAWVLWAHFVLRYYHLSDLEGVAGQLWICPVDLFEDFHSLSHAPYA